MAATLVATGFVVPALARVAWFLIVAMAGVGAVAAVLDAPRAEQSRSGLLLYVGGLLAVATIVAWLVNDRVGISVVLCLPWPLIAVLLHRGAGAAVPRIALWLPTLLVLAALLLWANLLLTLNVRPTDGAQRDVFAGWPWSHYLGAVRGNAPPTEAGLAAALWLDYALMLVVAALLLWRRPAAWLACWLPRLSGLMALAHLVGGYRLAFATDG